MSSSSIPVDNFYKSGSAMSITQGNLVCENIEQGSDAYGRWVYTTFTGREDHIITVVIAY
eukprot:15366554-Ditylum_brightwellii.AAC.1